MILPTLQVRQPVTVMNHFPLSAKSLIAIAGKHVTKAVLLSRKRQASFKTHFFI
jgi:hypothetical protein